MKKFVLKLDLHDGKDKQKAMRTVSSLSGIDSISMDMKGKKLTVIGAVDPVKVVTKLRKYWLADIISVGPAKVPEKKPEEAKKEEPKKPEDQAAKKESDQPKKTDEPKKEEEAKKTEDKKEDDKKKQAATPAAPVAAGPPPPTILPALLPPPDPVLELVKSYKAYNPHLTTYYYVQSMEENPNACVIC